MNENESIKRQSVRVEQERASRGKDETRSSEVGDAMQLKQMNTQLQKRIEFLQKREKDLVEHIVKFQKEKS